MKTFARFHQRREDLQRSAFRSSFDLFYDRRHALFCDWQITVWTKLRSGFCKQEPEKMINFRHRRDGRFAATARDALLDRHARWHPLTRSTSGFSSCSTNCRAYGDMLSRKRRCPSANKMSNARVDLPEPLKPVITTSCSRGILTSMFLRLCSRAP